MKLCFPETKLAVRCVTGTCDATSMAFLSLLGGKSRIPTSEFSGASPDREGSNNVPTVKTTGRRRRNKLL